MRGIVSLASAPALPLTTSADAPFPFRSEIILITFMLILATLVLHGLLLTRLIRALDLDQDQTLKEAHAREQAATAALARLDELSTESWPLAAQINR